MENNLQVFDNPEFGEVRMLVQDNEPWFVGKDIAEALGYAKARNAIASHVDTEDKKDAPIQGDLGGTQQMTIINESGLYSLILSSKLPKAKEFKRWVTSEVLPSIRKTGSYFVKRSDEELNLKRDEIQLEKSKLWLKLADRVELDDYKKIAESYAFNTLAGKPVLPLPEITQKTYSATEIGNMLGISKNKVGSLATKFNLKTNEFGKWFYDKSPYSAKEVETFRYYENVVPKLRELM